MIYAVPSRKLRDHGIRTCIGADAEREGPGLAIHAENQFGTGLGQTIRAEIVGFVRDEIQDLESPAIP